MFSRNILLRRGPCPIHSCLEESDRQHEGFKREELGMEQLVDPISHAHHIDHTTRESGACCTASTDKTPPKDVLVGGFVDPLNVTCCAPARRSNVMLLRNHG